MFPISTNDLHSEQKKNRLREFELNGDDSTGKVRASRWAWLGVFQVVHSNYGIQHHCKATSIVFWCDGDSIIDVSFFFLYTEFASSAELRPIDIIKFLTVKDAESHGGGVLSVSLVSAGTLGQPQFFINQKDCEFVNTSLILIRANNHKMLFKNTPLWDAQDKGVLGSKCEIPWTLYMIFRSGPLLPNS